MIPLLLMAHRSRFDAPRTPRGRSIHRLLHRIYYDLAGEFGSEDPTDPKKTLRVLTVMLAEEY